MEYTITRRREGKEPRVDLDTSGNEVKTLGFRSRNLYEWIAPDGTIFRSPNSQALDLKRYRLLEFTAREREEDEQEENQGPLDDEDQDVQDEDGQDGQQ